MSDHITLHREVAQLLLQVLVKGVNFKPGWLPECEDSVLHLRTVLAAPAPEPVAWRIVNQSPRLLTNWNDGSPSAEIIKWSKNWNINMEYAYAAPPAAPQPEPLTDEEIDAAIAKERDALLEHLYGPATDGPGVDKRVRKLARAAIDAAMREDKT